MLPWIPTETDYQNVAKLDTSKHSSKTLTTHEDSTVRHSTHVAKLPYDTSSLTITYGVNKTLRRLYETKNSYEGIDHWSPKLLCLYSQQQ